MAESNSLRRRNFINDLHASFIQYLVLSDELWGTDLENLIVALQSNRSLQRIYICGRFLAAIRESDQRRLFCCLGNLLTLQTVGIHGHTSSSIIHTRIVANALSETSNGVRRLELSNFTISSRSEVERLAFGLKARVG